MCPNSFCIVEAFTESSLQPSIESISVIFHGHLWRRFCSLFAGYNVSYNIYPFLVFYGSFLSLFTFDIRLVLFYPTLMFSKIVYFVCFSALGQMYHNCHVFILEYAHHPFFKRHRWILAFVLPHWVSSDWITILKALTLAVTTPKEKRVKEQFSTKLLFLTQGPIK